jgi:hypothetical protein
MKMKNIKQKFNNSTYHNVNSKNSATLCPVFTKSRIQRCKLVGKTFFPAAKVSSIENFVAFQSKLIQTRGVKYAVMRSKECTLYLIKLLAGIKYNTPGVRVYKGTPVDFQEFIPGVRIMDKTTIRFLLSVYTIYRHVTVPDDFIPDLSSITKPKVSNEVFENEFRKFVKIWKSKNNRSRNVCWTAPHLTANQGPNGKAIFTSVLERLDLSGKDEYHIKVLANSKEFDNYFDDVAKAPHGVVSAIDKIYAIRRHSERTQRRLSLIKDKYYKGRVIAMGDYWSQTVLRPYHEALNKILMDNFRQDCTYSQTSFKEKILGGSDESERTLYSVDLSNATDEFPIGITKIVIEEIFGKEISDSWHYLMVEKPFTNPWGPDVYYTKGQPMGMYSSWPAFAVTHNLVLKFLSWKGRIPTGKKQKLQPYVVLGDDIVIANDYLYNKYTEFLHMYEVPVNLNKSLISKDLCEFAKRLVSSTREEYSPFPINAIEEESKGFIQFSHFMNEMIYERNLPIQDLTMSGHKIIANLYLNMSNSPNLKDRNKRKFKKLSGFNKVLRNVVLQRDPYLTVLEKGFNLCKLSGIVYSCNTTPNSLGVITLHLFVQEKAVKYKGLISDTVKTFNRFVKDIGVVLPTNRTEEIEWMIEYLPLLCAVRHQVKDIQQEWNDYRQLIFDGKVFEAIKMKTPLPIIASLDSFHKRQKNAFRERINFNAHETIQFCEQAMAYYSDCSYELHEADAYYHIDSRLD